MFRTVLYSAYVGTLVFVIENYYHQSTYFQTYVNVLAFCCKCKYINRRVCKFQCTVVRISMILQLQPSDKFCPCTVPTYVCHNLPALGSSFSHYYSDGRNSFLANFDENGRHHRYVPVSFSLPVRTNFPKRNVLIVYV